jgi:predicted ATPase
VSDNLFPLRLQKVEIAGLFGRYNHSFDLAIDDRVTILHGPNGVGKTAALRLLFCVFSGRFFEILNTKFISFSLTFQGNDRIFIERVSSDSASSPEVLKYKVTSGFGLEVSDELPIDRRILTKFATSLVRTMPWLERVGEDSWVDRRNGETVSTLELLIRPEALEEGRLARLSLGDNLKPLSKAYKAFREISDRVNVHIIETQRLLRTQRKPDRENYFDRSIGDSEVRSTVNECAEDIRQRIASSLSRYATESQKRDQSFPRRLLAAAGPRPELDIGALEKRLRDVADKRSQLANVGLLVDQAENTAAGAFGDLDLAAAEESQRRVIDLYIEDTGRKLEVLDALLGRASLLLEIINSRFKHKRITLDRERGLVAIADGESYVRLDALSSGEQHQLVMFFDLIFKAKPQSLVLIDEPELSLHVTWQKALLKDLIQIANQSELDIVLATHSPYVVSNRPDLMRELGTTDYSDNDFGI